MTQPKLSTILLEQSKDLIWMIDLDLRLVYANKAYLKLMKEVTGVEKKLNESVLVEGFGEGYIEKWTAYYGRALKSEYFEIEEHYFNPLSNAIQYGQTTFEPLTGEDDKIFAVACQSRDITRIVKQRSESNQMMDASLDVFCTVNEQGNFVYVSAASQKLWGYLPEELIGTCYKDLILQEDITKSDEIIAASFIGVEINSFINRYKKKDGGIAYNLWSARWDETTKLRYAVAKDCKEQVVQEEKILQSEQLFKALIQEGSDLIRILDAAGSFMYVSPSSTSILGMAPEEFIGRNIFESIHPDDKERILASFQKITTEGRLKLEPYRVQNFKKEWLWFETVFTNMLNNPAVKGIVSNSRDVTESINSHKQTEENETFIRTILESSPDCLKVIDTEGRIQFMNFNGLCQMEVDDFESVKSKSWSTFWGSENEVLVKASVDKALAGVNAHFIAYCPTAKGTPKWWDVLVSPVGNPGEAVQKIISVSRDITEQKKEEQRLKLLESVITNTRDAVLITEAEPFDEPGPRIIYVNEAFTKMTGYTAAEVIGKTPRILQGPNTDTLELVRLRKAIKNWEPCEMTIINYKKSGEEFWINFVLTPVANEKGRYTHWISIEREVTDQKIKELENQLLAQISEHFNTENDYLKATNVVCKSVSLFGKFDLVEVWIANVEKSKMKLFCHHVAAIDDEKFYEYSQNVGAFKMAESMVGKVWSQKEELLWDDIENNKDFLRRDAAKKIGLKAVLGIPLISNNEVVGVLKIGTKQGANYLKKYSQLFKKLQGFIGSELDRKKLTNDLSHLFDAIPDILCLTDFDGRFLKINKAGCELLGYGEEEILYHNFDEFIHPADKDISFKEAQRLRQGEITFNFENRYLTKSGRIIWLSWFGNANSSEGIVYATAKNITEEKKLRELNREVSALVKIGSWEMDIVTQSIYWSDEIHKIHETDPKSFVPTLENVINFYRKDFRQVVMSNFENSIATGEPYDFEAVIITHSNKELWVRGTGNPEFVDGVCKRVYGSFQDISDRKESENRLMSLSENIPGVIYQYIIHPDGTDSMQHVSGGIEELWGYTKAEVTESLLPLWEEIRLGGSMELVKSSILKSIETKSKWTCRYKIVMPTGELRTHLGSGTPTFLADGSVVFDAIILDITQEVKNEELLTQASELARIGSWEMDLINQHGDGMYWSSMLRNILEVDASFNATFTNGLTFYLGQNKEKVQQSISSLISQGLEFDEEILIRTDKAHEKWIRVIGKSEMVNGKRTKIYGSFQDIHERKVDTLQLEESLRSLEDFKYSLDQSSIIDFTNEKGIITSVNDNFCEISKYSKEELVGKTYQLINSKHHPKEFFSDLWITISSGKVWRGEIKNKAKDGSFYWVYTTIVPFLDERSKPFQYLAIRYDITARKIAEQEKHSLQATLEISLNEIYIFDAETLLFSYANKGALVNIGYSANEIKLLTPLDVKPDFTATSFRKLVAPLVNNEKEKIIFFTNHKRKDGSLYPVEIHLQFVTEGNNKRFLAIVLDITERKKAAESILRANERFEKVTEATNDAIWDWDIVNKTYHRSKAIERFFGKETAKSYKNNNFWKENYHPEDLAKIKESIYEAIDNPTTNRWELEYRVINEVGEILYVIDRGVIVRNNEGKAIRVVGAMTDISVQKQMTLQLAGLNQSLQQYTTELERSNEELEQFAYVASHDLQEPLRMISSFMNLLERKYKNQLDAKGHEYIHFATDGAKRMKQIILDLLEYSRTNKPTEGKQEVDMNELLSEFKLLRRKLISEKNATVKYGDLPTLSTYKAAITQILHCLLDNALKYSLKGTPAIVEINVVENEKAWEFSIKDNGIGIEAQFYDKIFIIFQRLHNKEEYAGTGIGLAITKRHVEFLGGRIWLESAPGEGSTFYFTIAKTN